MLAVHEDAARRMRVLAEDRDVGRRLHDLKREWRIHRARHPEQEALRLVVLRRAVPEVLLLLRARPRLIWDLVALDDALASGHAKPRGMILNVPVRRRQRLPDAVQIGLAVGG